jgi:mRNA interferase MazF
MKMRISIKKGDILLINFEPVRGSEQGRVRPALVVQNDVLNRFSPITIVTPITSRIYSKEYPTNVEITKFESGIKLDSTILTNQIRAVNKSRIIKKIGSLNHSSMKKVDLAIKITLDLQ